MKKYQIIYADPPWAGGTECLASKSHIVDKNSYHYPAMATQDICNLGIGLRRYLDDNCLLFLWVRSPALEDGLQVGKAWGFKYATVSFVWYKERTNPGHYTMSECELNLVFKRNKIPLPRGSRNERQFLASLRRKHSEKPLEIMKRIERMFPTQNKLELFARQKVEGWDCWGNEVESDIELLEGEL